MRKIIVNVILIVLLAYGISQGLRVVTWRIRPTVPISIGFGDPLPDSTIQALGPRVLLIATSDRCPHSLKSVDFHRSLIDFAHGLGLPVVLVSPRGREVPSGVATAVAGSDEIRGGAAASLGIAWTPTVVLVEEGTVSGIWVGCLDDVMEDSLQRSVKGKEHALAKPYRPPAAPSSVQLLSTSEVDQRLRSSLVLDVQDRERFQRRHVSGALNIPRDELGARVEIEILRKSQDIIVDCSSVDFGACILVGELMEARGFTNVWLLDMGANGGSRYRTSALL